MADVLESFRTTNGMWLEPPVSARVTFAKYIPDTAVVGTGQVAETAQFPQSIKAVAESVMHAGWV
jgi:hypothetical protein